VTDKLGPNSKLNPGNYLLSTNGMYRFILQNDGNLVLYREQAPNPAKPRWASNTTGKASIDAVMQNDGNFVIYDANKEPLWASNTAGHPGSIIVAQNDGNVVIYDPTGKPLWATNTYEIIVRVGVEWINSFNNQCFQKPLPHSADHAEGFYNAMGNKGHIRVFHWGDNNAWATDFRHPNFGGDSLNWIDDVHFCWYSDHGGNVGDVLLICFTNYQHGCNDLSDRWLLGVNRLKWLVLSCCEGVANTDKIHVAARWFPCAQGIHMIFTFIGTSWQSDSNSDLGSNFGDDVASGDKLTEAWLDDAYSYWLNNHPIIIAFDSTVNDVIDRIDNETLSWRDKDAGNNWLCYKCRT
jgi:hypothetical protein